jgi:hypothetical protein
MRREIQGLEALEQQIARGLDAMKLRRVSDNAVKRRLLRFLTGYLAETPTICKDVPRKNLQSHRNAICGILYRSSHDGKRMSTWQTVMRTLMLHLLRQCFVSVVFPPLATSKIAQSETAENDTAQAKGNVNGDWISYSIAWGLSRLPTGVVDIAVWSRAIS